MQLHACVAKNVVHLREAQRALFQATFTNTLPFAASHNAAAVVNFGTILVVDNTGSPSLDYLISWT